MCKGPVDYSNPALAGCTWCHTPARLPGGGFAGCTLRKNHGGTRHIDTIHNRSFPMTVRSNESETSS